MMTMQMGEDNMKWLTKEEVDVVVAVLKSINLELDRCYWNEYQDYLDSPFANTGAEYKCDAFSVHAYEWIEENKDNFVYPKDGIHVEWYKYLGRGTEVWVPDDWTLDKLPAMLQDCKEAIRKDFGEGID